MSGASRVVVLSSFAPSARGSLGTDGRLPVYQEPCHQGSVKFFKHLQTDP
jgi:hypothetical protein